MGLIRFILIAYIIIIILDVVMEFLPQLRKYEASKYVQQLSSYSVNFVRKFLSSDLPFFAAHIVVIVLIYLLKAIW